MPSQSVIGAVIERYESFTFANRPPICFDEADLKAVGASSSSAFLKPPYVILKDGGTRPDDTFEKTQERTRLNFEVYALTLAAADAIVEGIRFNGGGQREGNGMDYATTLPLTNYTLKHMILTNMQRFIERDRNNQAVRVYRCAMTYDVLTLRTTA